MLVISQPKPYEHYNFQNNTSISSIQDPKAIKDMSHMSSMTSYQTLGINLISLSKISDQNIGKQHLPKEPDINISDLREESVPQN